MTVEGVANSCAFRCTDKKRVTFIGLLPRACGKCRGFAGPSSHQTLSTEDRQGHWRWIKNSKISKSLAIEKSTRLRG